MKFYPKNRHLFVEPIELRPTKKSDEGVFAIPDEELPRSQYVTVKLISKSPESTFSVSENQTLVVLSHQVNKIEIGGETFSVVPESAVVGVLVDV